MAKTEKELQELKEKFEALSKELESLSEEEMQQVAGGLIYAGNTLLIPAKGFKTESRPHIPPK